MGSESKSKELVDRHSNPENTNKTEHDIKCPLNTKNTTVNNTDSTKNHG